MWLEVCVFWFLYVYSNFFIVSQFDSDQFVPIATVARFNQVSVLNAFVPELFL